MGKLALTLAVLFLSSAALSCASEVVPENDASSGGLSSAVVLPESNPKILLPTESDDSAASKLPENELRTVESNEGVTTVTFRPADHGLDGRPTIPVSFRFPFRHRRPCRQGRRPFKPLESDPVTRFQDIPYGNDMVQVDQKPDSETEGSQDPAQRPRFHHHHHHHHHGEPESEEKGQMFGLISHSFDGPEHDHGMKRFHHGHRHFEREEHEHHHRRHHRDEDSDSDSDDEEEEEKGGLLMRFRKFLMDRF